MKRSEVGARLDRRRGAARGNRMCSVFGQGYLLGVSGWA